MNEGFIYKTSSDQLCLGLGLYLAISQKIMKVVLSTFAGHTKKV